MSHPDALLHKTILLNIFTANLLTQRLTAPLHETIFHYTIAKNCLQYIQFNYPPSSFHTTASRKFLLDNLVNIRSTVETYIITTGEFLKSLGITKEEWPFLYEQIPAPLPIDISD